MDERHYNTSSEKGGLLPATFQQYNCKTVIKKRDSHTKCFLSYHWIERIIFRKNTALEGKK